MSDFFSFLLVGLSGLFVGSFLNVVIHRGPALWNLVDEEKCARGTLAGPRSQCPSCAAPIRYVDLVPVANYVWLRGKCRDCGAPISPRYPLVEIAGAAAAIASVALFGPTAGAGFAFLFFCALIALAVIDHETGYLPDAITLPLIAGGLAVNAGGALLGRAMFTHGAVEAVIGAVAGYGAFFLIAEGYRRLRGRDGLGLGDAKLLGAIGAWVGWPALAPTVFLASLIALAFVLIQSLRGGCIEADTPVRFGPALCAAGAAAFLAKPALGI